MLARMFVVLPFDIYLCADAQYTIYEIVEGEYTIRVGLPESDGQVNAGRPEQVLIDDVAAIAKNILVITFVKTDFNRAVGAPVDPPEELMEQAIQSTLARLKYVTRSHQIPTLTIKDVSWHLQYLNDDESELPAVSGFHRGVGARRFNLTCLPCPPQTWNHLFNLPEGFQPPSWYLLLVDAQGAMPYVGTALVLAATALEIFIDQLLDALAPRNHVDPAMWQWINRRGREPQTTDQYDTFLKLFTGRSLKESNDPLWQALNSIRTARHNFVHEGVAKLKIDNAVVTLTEAEVAPLLASAWEIVSEIREWIPEDLRWPVFKSEMRVSIVQQLMAVAPLDNSGH